jgi:hypothetical protein
MQNKVKKRVLLSLVIVILLLIVMAFIYFLDLGEGKRDYAIKNQTDKGVGLESEILKISEEYVINSKQYQEYTGYNLKLESVFPMLDCGDYCFEVVYLFNILEKDKLLKNVEGFRFAVYVMNNTILNVTVTEIINGEIVCAMDVKECPDGTFVSRIAPDCEFKDCSDPFLFDESRNYCEEKRPEICILLYAPVCGYYKNGFSKTYGNSCTACSDANVSYWTIGEC